MLKPHSVRHKRGSLFIPLLGLAALAGCAAPMRFPATALSETQTPEGTVRAYTVDAKGRADFFTTQGADGRIFRIAYDTSGGGKPDSFVDLDEIQAPDCRHLIIVLDGASFSNWASNSAAIFVNRSTTSGWSAATFVCSPTSAERS